jgi:hypothetical protein
LRIVSGCGSKAQCRLYEIAEIFDVPVKSLFGGIDKQKQSRGSSPFDLLSDALPLQMAQEFSKIREKGTRRAIMNLVEAMI